MGGTVLADKNLILVSVAMVALAVSAIQPTNAQAQTEATGSLQPRTENGRQIYDAAQFDRFNPRTALDMVNQVPGFIIDTGDNNERGLGQADENVLINGARISGKNVNAFTALGRISASNVTRIEIVDGATLSITGLSGQVLNLVTKSEEGGGITGNFKWRPQWRRSGNSWLGGEMSINGKLGKGNFTLAVENDAFRFGGRGPEQVTDQFGALLFERDEVARGKGDRPKFSAAYNRTSEGGSIFNINAEYQIFRFRDQVETLRTQMGQSDIFELFTFRENEWNGEVSADYEFKLGGGRLKLIGLQRYEHSPSRAFFGQTFTDGITPPTSSRFDRVVDEGESVIRSEYGWKTAGGTDWGISLEGAYNFLESTVLDAQLNPLPNTRTKVTEYRGEAIGSYGRALSGNLTLQATLGGEYSKISQSGGGGESRSFIRPKGSLSLAWKPEDGLDLSLKIEREVGQLNFFDFVASTDVANGVGTEGNTGLVPPQSWTAELEMTKKLGAWGSGTVTIYGEKVTDIVDSIPITATTEARGNLPSANRFGVKLVSSILFDPIGWNGAKLDIEGEVRKSSLRDPLLGNFRRTNNDKIFTYEISLRHDVPNTNWAWGGGAEDFRFSDNLRLDQIQSFKTSGPFTWIFVEHKDVFGLTVNAKLGILLNRGE